MRISIMIALATAAYLAAPAPVFAAGEGVINGATGSPTGLTNPSPGSKSSMANDPAVSVPGTAVAIGQDGSSVVSDDATAKSDLKPRYRKPSSATGGQASVNSGVKGGIGWK